MGILRLLLAISVVIFHQNTGLKFLVGGLYAVKLFFVISGFYMALILHEKYTGAGSTRLFYCNRLLRLLPAYYCVLALIVLAPLMAGLFLGRSVTFGNMNYWKFAGASLPHWLASSFRWLHLTPLGQELPWAGVLDLTSNAVRFQVPPEHKSLQLYSFMLLTPAWSLSLELQYYAIAPFLVRRSVAVLSIIFAISLALYWLLPLLPFGNEKFWRDYSLPVNLGYFALGMIGYRIYRAHTDFPILGWLALRGRWFGILLITLIFAHPWLPINFREPLTTGCFALALPFVFSSTSNLGWDRSLGELSYPLYLGHWLVNNAWYAFVPVAQKRIAAFQHAWVNALLVVVISLALAAVIHCFVERPIDRFRQQWVRRKLTVTPQPAP